MRTEPIRIEDFRREEAKHDAEHFPAECRESFANIARSTVRAWSKGNDRGEWGAIEAFPVLCREWLRQETQEQLITHDNKQIGQSAVWCLILGGDTAYDKLTEFLTDWLWRGESLR